MKLNHKTSNSDTHEKTLNIQHLRNQHSYTISIKPELQKKAEKRLNVISLHRKDDDEHAAYNIRKSIHNMKTSLKNIYEVVRGLFGIEKMPITRAEEILNHLKFREDETPEQRLMTIAAAERILARRDAQKAAENTHLTEFKNYGIPQSEQHSSVRKSLKTIIAEKQAKQDSEKTLQN